MCKFTFDYEFGLFFTPNLFDIYSINNIENPEEEKKFVLVKEKINNKVFFFTRQIAKEICNNINCLLFVENFKSFFVFYSDKRYFVQHNINSGKILNKYTLSKVEDITSAIQYKQFFFYGGLQGNFGIFNLKNKTIVGKLIDTSVNWIYSLQICRVKDKKNEIFDQFYLAVCGEEINYDKNTDMFDVTKLINS